MSQHNYIPAVNLKGNTMEILVYGLKQGETRDYMENLLACFPKTDKAALNIEKVKAAASAQGFHSFRISGYKGEAPNFAKTLNI